MTISTVTTVRHRQALVRIDIRVRAGAATRDSWCGQELTPRYWGILDLPREDPREDPEDPGGGGREHCRGGLWRWLFTNLHENLLVFHLVRP